MSSASYVRARLRRTTVIAATGAIVAAGLLVPASASAVVTPTTRSNVLGGTSLSADGWTGPAAGVGSPYDFSTKSEVLTASNFGADGVITQLESPVTQAAGEPGYTSASYDEYHFAFTLGGHAPGSNKYAAQPGVGLEVDADGAGNRAGGGVYFNVPANNVLEIDNFGSTDPSGQLWDGGTKRIPFNAPVAIDYTVQFVAGGKDVVTIKANGKTVISTTGSTFEGYSFAKAASEDTTIDASAPNAATVDQVLFRTTHNQYNTEWTSENTDPNVAPWTPMSAPVPTSKGGGFTFSSLTYGAKHSSSSAFASTSTVTTNESDIQNYEDSTGSNYDSWHIGSNGSSSDPNQYFNVLSNGDVQLNDYAPTDTHSVQLLKGYPAGSQPDDVYALVKQGLAWTLTTDQLGSLQIPVFGANVAHSSGTTGFATLHSQAQVESTGLNVAKLSDSWVATHAIGDIPANHAATLGELLAALEPGVAADPDTASTEPTEAIADADVTVLGIGVASEATAGQTSTTFGPIYFGGVKHTFTSAPTITVGTPTVTGTPAVGETLTSSTPEVNPIDVKLSYQWLRNGASISGATSSSYKLTSSDYKKTLSVKVSGTATGHAKVAETSLPTIAVALGTITTVGEVGISGSAQVGVKLSLTKPTYTPSSATLTYKWLRNGTAIAGATKSTYTVVKADLGATLTATITAKKTDYTTLPLTSASTDTVAPGTLAVTAAPTISGTVKVGKTLTASSKTWTANGVATTSEKKTYNWYVSDSNSGAPIGDPIQSSTSSTFTIPASAAGQFITVTVTGTLASYTTVTSGFSDFTAAVQ